MVSFLNRGPSRWLASAHRSNRRLRLGAGLSLGLAFAACSVELGPLASKPDAASGGGAGADAGADGCVGCFDATVSDGCPAGLTSWASGRCCSPELNLEFKDTMASGVVVHGETAIVYGARASRPWAARVDRCNGAILAESSDFVSDEGQMRGATLSGDTLVLAGSYLAGSKSRWMAAWGDANSLTGFQTYQDTSSTATMVSAVAMESTSQAWFAGTDRFGQSEPKALLTRLNLSTSTKCTFNPSGSTGEGAGLGLNADAINFVSRVNSGLYISQDSLSSCGVSTCKCNGKGKLIDMDGRTIFSARAATPRNGAVYAVGGSVVQVFPVTEQGVYVVRTNADLSLDGRFIWEQGGSLVDDAFALDVDSDGAVAVGVARGCDFWLYQVGQNCAFGALFGLPAGFDDKTSPTFETTVSDVNEVRGVRFEPEPTGGILVVGNANPKSRAVLKRCSRAGECP